MRQQKALTRFTISMKYSFILLAFLISTILSFGQSVESCYCVSLDKMNYLYVDIDNPITIATNFDSQTRVSVDNGEIRNTISSMYIIHPTSIGMLTITIELKNGRKNKYFYSIRELPKPIISNISSFLTLSSLPNLKTLEVISGEPYFDIAYKVDSFLIMKISNYGNKTIKNIGAEFSSETKSLFLSCSLDDKILFTDIQCTYLLTKKIAVPDLLVNLK